MPFLRIERDSPRLKLILYILVVIIMFLVFTLNMSRFIQYYSEHFGDEDASKWAGTIATTTTNSNSVFVHKTERIKKIDIGKLFLQRIAQPWRSLTSFGS